MTRAAEIAAEQCEWNPVEQRPAWVSDPPHGVATTCVGDRGQWHLCDACARLPEFRRFKKRSPLRRNDEPK